MVMKKSMKKLASLLLAASMAFAMAGCGGGGGDADTPDAQGGGAKDAQGAGEGTAGGEGASAQGPAAMGRYVEEETDLSEQLTSPKSMCLREDGSLAIVDGYAGVLVSGDQGVTWKDETPDWFWELKKNDTYVSNLNMAPDGTMLVIYGVSGEEIDDYTQELILMLPDGGQVAVEQELTEDEGYFRQAVATADNRLFASTFRSVYEISLDGSAEKLLALDASPDWIWVRDNLLFIDDENDGLQGLAAPVIYDLDAGTYIEDETLVEFVSDNYADRHYNGSDYGTIQLLPGEDNSVYVIGKKGIHRHVIGGNMMEQVVDGNLSLLSNPSYAIVDMMQLEGDVFLGLFVNGKLIKFTYDPDIPSVPENVLTIYSLKDDDNIRQAVSLYQTKHPDVFVSYKIGMGDNDSVTREDAVKKLNTEIMAGEGPDLLVMDGLPLASYIDKGLLLDLTGYLEDYSAKEPLFDNMTDALKRGGKAYVVPATVSVPQIVAKAEGAENMTDLSKVAEVVEKLREEYPGKDIIGISGERGLMKRFAATSAPKWIAQDGAVDREAIGTYLEECKRILDAQMDGLDEDIRVHYEERTARMEEHWGEKVDETNRSIYMEMFGYIGGEQQLMAGWVDAAYTYRETNSIEKTKGFEDTKVLPMQGQCRQVFRPVTMLGVSAASHQTDMALGFVDTFLSAEVQEVYEGLPLNQAAFDAHFTPKEEYLGENGEYGGWASSNADGMFVEFISYWPTDDQIAAFKQLLSSVDTAYVPDGMVESAVFDQGVEYMRGGQSLEQALDKIERAVAIYMAE